ncbi:SPOSA6832_02507 [Sporobolomyces salmonicolor]|uniref:SPOSA6832_02507-mRNA-1:cds n=1 Tax=Sporidiobolus salmonicolor TaxID=5005 RepID=A0A0D6EMK4_SPOSA|nr:SPOSA6832_02507 [Sporobolomyces salmonicolor]
MPAPTLPDILTATLPDVRPLASLLKSLSFKAVCLCRFGECARSPQADEGVACRSQRATVRIDAEGIRMTVEEGRSIQAHAYITRACFTAYTFILSADSPSACFSPLPSPPSPSSSSSSSSSSPPPPPEPRGAPYCQLTVSLSTMLECLNIFGNAGTAGGGNGFQTDQDGGERHGGGEGGWKRRRGRGSGDDEEGRGRAGGRGRDQGGADEGKQTSLRLSYAGIGEPLVMLLEESGTVTRCELTTYEPDGLLDLAFEDADRVQRLIMKSEWLRDALLELPPSSEKLTISFSPVGHRRATPSNRYRSRSRREGMGQHDEGGGEADEDEVPLFRLESVGTLGSTEMDYSDDRDILEVFECEFPIRNTTDEYGLVSFQFMIPLSGKGGAKASMADGRVAFVEFLCVALDDEY